MNQVKEQSYDEKFDMYMECDKEDLVRMIIEANKKIDKNLPNENIKRPKNEVVDNNTSRPFYIKAPPK